MSHTQGNLSIGRHGEVTTQAGDMLLLRGVALGGGSSHYDLCKTNARRLVACWNACDGISTEELEDGAIQKLREQRDELLFVLKARKSAEEYGNEYSPHRDGI